MILHFSDKDTRSSERLRNKSEASVTQEVQQLKQALNPDLRQRLCCSFHRPPCPLLPDPLCCMCLDTTMPVLGGSHNPVDFFAFAPFSWCLELQGAWNMIVRVFCGCAQ